jgi:hypothetical protein
LKSEMPASSASHFLPHDFLYKSYLRGHMVHSPYLQKHKTTRRIFI